MQFNLTALHVPALMLNTFLGIIGLICLDAVLGMLQAIIRGTWKWNKVGQFLQTSVLRYLIGLTGLGFYALINSGILPVFYTAAGTVAVNLGADIISKLNSFGIQVPETTTTNATGSTFTASTDPNATTTK